MLNRIMYISTEKPDYSRPELDSDCLILVASDGFITDEQRMEAEENGSFGVDSVVKPEKDITLSEYMQEISTYTGHNYELIGEFNTNIGILNLYKNVP